MTRTEQKSAAVAVACRKPTLADAAAIHALVAASKPLDLNSPYAYMLLATHFGDTCAVAERGGELLGFVSGYLKPADPAVLFIWQVAVSDKARGQGVGKRLLREVLSRPICFPVRHLETTVTPSNQASRALFASLARDHGASCAESILFRSDDFGPERHEEEKLLRIGPLRTDPKYHYENHQST
jgi:L-2,4-diaminobutyric acid acetyltransferase